MSDINDLEFIDVVKPHRTSSEMQLPELYELLVRVREWVRTGRACCACGLAVSTRIKKLEAIAEAESYLRGIKVVPWERHENDQQFLSGVGVRWD
jgi:hypothetical protein